MEESLINTQDIADTLKLVVRGLAVILGVIVLSALFLVASYFVSQALLPHWPPDYHASIAICVLMVVAFGGVGLFVFQSTRHPRASRE